MLVMHLCVSGIDVVHVFVFKGHRCWSCICVLGLSLLVMYLFVRVSRLIMYLCARGIDVGHVFVCRGIHVGHVFVC